MRKNANNWVNFLTLTKCRFYRKFADNY